MLNFILAPLGILLIGLGAVGLFLALRKRRTRTEPEVIEADRPSGPEAGI
jgi:hypothetical protein